MGIQFICRGQDALDLDQVSAINTQHIHVSLGDWMLTSEGISSASISSNPNVPSRAISYRGHRLWAKQINSTSALPCPRPNTQLPFESSFRTNSHVHFILHIRNSNSPPQPNPFHPHYHIPASHHGHQHSHPSRSRSYRQRFRRN